MSTEEKIKVMQAYVDGEDVYRRDRQSFSDTEYRINKSADVTWDWGHYVYYVKHKPKIIYVNEFDTGPFTVHPSVEEASNCVIDCPTVDRIAVEYIELTDEVKKKLGITYE